MSSRPLPPENLEELLERANQIAGFTLGQLANRYQIEIPQDLRRDKGWIGQLLEYHLGATAGSKPWQDFPELGVELKTLPINSQGKPLETTFVCVAPLTQLTGETWETSHVRHKLSRVLWVPVLSERDIPLAERQIGTPVLWQPSPAEERLLQEDWQELTDMIAMGQVETITARHGRVLQLRPKGANRHALTDAFDQTGQRFQTLPRGFYLRIPFTHAILTQYFCE